jgi:hypothetical protein
MEHVQEIIQDVVEEIKEASVPVGNELNILDRISYCISRPSGLVR